jgi:general secretion pathway protein D
MIGDALIEVDLETRSVIIITDEETNEQISTIIATLDQPKPQVLIKVVFLEVTHRDDLDLGVQMGYLNEGGSTTNLIQSAFGLAIPSQGGLYQLSNDNFTLTMKALAEAGKVEVLSRPTILARNNQEAVITIGQEVPFVRNTQILQGGQTFNTIEYEDIGIILRVTPFITKDGLVEMIVAPEISTITDETVPISDGVDAPVFAKRSVDTVVVTGDGQTVIIGGLLEKNVTEVVRKVPLLGDIPWLGAAFRRTVKAESKTELLIFLTPHIIYDPFELTRLSQLERERASKSVNGFKEEDLNRFLGDIEEGQIDPSNKGKSSAARKSSSPGVRSGKRNLIR